MSTGWRFAWGCGISLLTYAVMPDGPMYRQVPAFILAGWAWGLIGTAIDEWAC